MPEVKFIMTADEISAVNGFVKVMRAQAGVEKGARDAAAAFGELDRQAMRSTKSLSDYYAKLERRTNVAYEQAKWEKHVAPARFMGGIDLNDSGAVAFVRFQKAQQLRAGRATDAAAAAEADTNAASLRLSTAVSSAYQDFKEDHAEFMAKRATAKAKSLGLTMSSLTSAATVTGALIVGAAYAGEQYADALKQMMATRQSFENELTPLFSLRGNYGRQNQIRDRVISISEATGKSTGEVSQSLFNLEAGTPGMNDSSRMRVFQSASMLTRLSGGQLDQNLTALIKSYQMYGNQIGDVDKIQAKLFQTMQRGYVPMERLTALLPELLPAAKSFGVTFDELTGTLATATRLGGSDEKALTSIRDLFIKMTEAQREGIPLTGTFVEKLHELSQMSPAILSRIFDERTIAMIVQLANHTGEIAENIQKIQASAPGDLKKAYVQKYSDPINLDSSLDAGLDQGLQHVDISKSKDAALRQQDILYKAFQLGWEQSAPLWQRKWGSWLVEGVGGIIQSSFRSLPTEVGPGTSHIDQNIRRGLLQIIGNQRDKGGPDGNFQADLEELEFGAFTNSTYDVKEMDQGLQVIRHKYTNADDVENYTRLLKDHPRLTTGGYRQYRTLQNLDSSGKRADDYLHAIDTGPALRKRPGSSSQTGDGGVTEAANTQLQAAQINLQAAQIQLAIAQSNVSGSPLGNWNRHA